MKIAHLRPGKITRLSKINICLKVVRPKVMQRKEKMKIPDEEVGFQALTA